MGRQKQEEAASLGSRVLLSAVQLPWWHLTVGSASNLDADVQEGENFPTHGLLSKLIKSWG